MLKNIVVVSDFGYVNGGNSKVTIESSLYISELYNVYLFVGEDKIDERLLSSNIKIIKAGGEEFVKSHNKAKSFLKFIFDKDVYTKLDELLKGLNKEETIVHVHSWPKVLSPSIFKAIYKNGFKVLITCHDYFSICPNGGLYNYQKNKICHCRNKAACFFSNCDSRSYAYKMVRNVRYSKQKKYMNKVHNKGNLNFGIISRSQEPLFRDKFDRANYYYIPNDIDLYKDKKIDVNKNKTFFFIGRVSKEKGIDLLLEAFKRLKNYELHVIGEGPALEESKKKATPNVRFLGWKNKNDINELVKEARALVFPSIWYEGSPLTIPEVMSAGVPCVVSSSCNGKDFITDNKNGFIFKANDIDDLVNTIEKVYTSDISNISSEARKIVDNYNDIYAYYREALQTIMEDQ